MVAVPFLETPAIVLGTTGGAGAPLPEATGTGEVMSVVEPALGTPAIVLGTTGGAGAPLLDTTRTGEVMSVVGPAGTLVVEPGPVGGRVVGTVAGGVG